MTGEEHYRRAEAILIDVGTELEEDIRSGVGSSHSASEDAVWIALAQVHATLAVAAYTADRKDGA